MAEFTWKPEPTSRDCTVERVDAVAFTPMPAALRNQLITRTYGDIAQAMVDLLGPQDITWCAVGQWASHTIGDFLDLPVPFVGGVITRHFADGNRDVFADIARAHAVFLETVGAAASTGDDLDPAWRDCRRRLRLDVLEPPGRVRGDDERFWDSITADPAGSRRPNQRALLLGFEAYRRALDMPESEARRRTILLGNILLALHEQRHLTMAISLGFRAWLRTLTMPSMPLTTTRAWLNRDPGGWRVGLENWWIRTATRFFIRLDLGPGRIRVSKPVPAGGDPVVFEPDRTDSPQAGAGRFSTDEMLQHFYETLRIDGRKAECWNSLRDRMAYIAALFVEHQRSDRWFSEPGVVLRADIDADLDEQVSRLVPSERAPVGDHDTVDHTLDVLRMASSTPEVEGELGFADLLGDKIAMQQSLGLDLDRRLDALLGENGLWRGDTLDRSHAVFGHWRVLMMMALLFRSLPDAYAAASGVKVIGTVSRLETDPFRRAGETAHFVREMLGDRDAWRAVDERWDNDVYRSLAGLRSLHSIVSERLVADGWDSNRYGVPINQEDVLGTALSFVVPVLDLADRLDAPIDAADRNALVHFWLGIGHLLGAPIEVITVDTGSGLRLLDADEAAAVAAVIRDRHHARSLDGVRLTEALIEGVADGFPRRMRWLVRGWMLALGEEATVDLLLVAAGQSHRRAGTLAKVLGALIGFGPTRPMARWALNEMGGRWLEPFFDEGAARPYRRPRKANESGGAALVSAYWPAGCNAPEPSPATPDAPPTTRRRSGRVRARRLSRQRRRFRARS